MSEKPFWVGKTCKEMANLRVKVTFKNGTVATGVTDECGDIDGVDSLSCVDVDDKFVPCSYVDTIELLDDPEYERIDIIEDVRVGDVFVAKDGNRYAVTYVDCDDDKCRCNVAIDSCSYDIDNAVFSYALRPKPKLPDHDGLWLDKNGKTWVVSDGGSTLFDPESLIWRIPRISGDAFGTKSDTAIDLAPFRPAKAVEV